MNVRAPLRLGLSKVSSGQVIQRITGRPGAGLFCNLGLRLSENEVR